MAHVTARAWLLIGGWRFRRCIRSLGHPPGLAQGLPPAYEGQLILALNDGVTITATAAVRRVSASTYRT